MNELLNKAICEIVGICWHEWERRLDNPNAKSYEIRTAHDICLKCGKIYHFRDADCVRLDFLTILGLYERVIPCPTCKGKGYNEGVEGGCPHCHGGRVSLMEFIELTDEGEVCNIQTLAWAYVWNPLLLALDWLKWKLEQVKCDECKGTKYTCNYIKRVGSGIDCDECREHDDFCQDECVHCNGTGHKYHAELKEIERMREVMK